MTAERQASASSRRISSELCIVPSPSLETEGAGKAGRPLHPGPRAEKICASAKTTGTGGDHTGPPRAMVYGLYALSPVNHPVCHRRPCDAERIVTHLAPDLGAPGPHDFAVCKNRRSSVSALRVHRIPASRVVTTAIRPSEKRGGMSALYAKLR
jgi:hypothetical protein